MNRALILLLLVPAISLAEIYTPPVPAPHDFYDTTRIINDMKLSQAPKDSFLMFGDSITQGINPNDIHFKYVNLGIGGDMAHSMFQRIKAVNLEAYKGVFVSVGANNFLRGQSGARLGDEIAEIINYAAPRSRQLFVTETFVPNKGKHPQVPDDFPSANIKIYSTCHQYKNCIVLPLPKNMIGNDGLDSKMSIDDGVHLNSKAYELWKIALNKKIADFPVNYYYRIRY